MPIAATDGRSDARSALLRRIAIASLAAALCIWGTTSLGFWQLRRAAGKEMLQQQIDAAASASPVDADATMLASPAAMVHRHVRLRGRWLPDRAVYLDNRPRDGQAGFYVLMPLRLDAPLDVDVIVNRGWTPRNINDRARIEPVRTPSGSVDVTGVALADEPKLLELAKPGARALGGIWQNFDFDAFALLAGQPPLPFVLRQDTESATPGTSPSIGDGLARDWPDRGGVLQGQIDRHHGYAFQWFALAATLAALLLFHVFRTLRHGRTDLRTDPR